MTTSGPLVQINDLGFAFTPGVPVLQGIDFSLERGGYLSIIGPNGAGKTTLLKCLLRLHPEGKTSGRVLVDGLNAATLTQRELARHIAYVPQAGGWIPPFTVLEFASLSRFAQAEGRRRPAAGRAAVDRALRLTGLEGLADRPLRALSGGERQRAFLAAALAQDAPLLLLDEPAAFLDPRHVSQLNALLRLLNREQGLTMLTVTHDLNHPQAMGGKALVLKGGRQLYFGAVEGLIALPVLNQAFEHEFVRLSHPLDGRAVILAE